MSNVASWSTNPREGPSWKKRHRHRASSPSSSLTTSGAKGSRPTSTASCVKGTDPAFTGRFTHPGPDGQYRCAACGTVLFDSATQFDSGSGWPSFTEPANLANVELHTDTSLGMVRTEVTCKHCGGHLGHLFDDGPSPAGQRWCINSSSLELDPDRG